jgi:hypothetical protein
MVERKKLNLHELAKLFDKCDRVNVPHYLITAADEVPFALPEGPMDLC